MRNTGGGGGLAVPPLYSTRPSLTVSGQRIRRSRSGSPHSGAISPAKSSSGFRPSALVAAFTPDQVSI